MEQLLKDSTLKLDGWADAVAENITDYDEIFRKLKNKQEQAIDY